MDGEWKGSKRLYWGLALGLAIWGWGGYAPVEAQTPDHSPQLGSLLAQEEAPEPEIKLRGSAKPRPPPGQSGI